MDNKKIAIVCDGKEIAYGMNLYHLMKYEENGVEYRSEKCRNIDIDMYSSATYRHSNVSKKVFTIFIGNKQAIAPSMNKIFDDFGMQIWVDESKAILSGTSEPLYQGEYERFLKFAESMKNEYVELESEYFKSFYAENEKWINVSFDKVSSGGLFKQNNLGRKVQQQYDCLAFVFYLKYICKM